MTDVNFDKLKIIFIDWYLTLTSVTFLNKLKIENYALFRKFIDVIFEHNTEGWQYEWARGNLTKEDAAEKISQAGVSSKEKILQIFADCSSNQILDYPEILQIIQKIRQLGVKVVIATDNWDVFTDYTVPQLHLDDYFDDILSSNQVGYLKRDVVDNCVPFFEKYMDANNISKEEVILLDDAKINVDICQKYEIPAVQIKSCLDTLSLLKMIGDKKCKKN